MSLSSIPAREQNELEHLCYNASMKIVVLGPNPNENQKSRLEKLGDVSYLPSAESSEIVVNAAKDADVLYSNGAHLLESLPKLKNIFVTYPYIELGHFNTDELSKVGVTIANSQGGNRASIIEWVMFMMLELFRKLTHLVRASENMDINMQESLEGKKVLIVGKGSIGSKIAVPCEAFGMKVDFYERGDELLKKAKDVDIIINSLNVNSTSKNLLNEAFFMSLKKGAYYISFVRPYTYDVKGLIRAIDAGIIAGAGIDCDPEDFGDTKNEFYQTCMSNEKILVTPHVAFSTKQAIANGGEIAIRNIEEFVNGNPQNILSKN